MKLAKITHEEDVYTVHYEPNRIEKLLGFKAKEEKYKDIKKEYKYSHANVYINQKGEILGIFHKMTAILDNNRRAF